MPRGDPSEGDIVEAEGLGHGTQVALLCFMDRTIGLRDVEQAVEDILQQSRFIAKRRRHLSRIGLEPGRGALGKVEQPLDAGPLPLADLDDLGEGLDLGRRHHAVRFRHLGGQCHEAGGEDDIPRRRAEDRTLPIHQEVTGDTADRLRVTNRLNSRQSIRAGGEYLADLIDQLPPEIKKPDRIWLALAAYNLGMGHMNGARAIAKGLRRDPSSWYEMKQVLPLLAREKYYNRLKSGRGRGGEAVIMVENIRTYFDILCRFETARSGPVSPEFMAR